MIDDNFIKNAFFYHFSIEKMKIKTELQLMCIKDKNLSLNFTT